MSDNVDQAHRAYDDSPQRFRYRNFSDLFSGVLFEQAMAQTRMAICLSDPGRDDNPIVFANRAFLELTGYPEREVVGRNCRFLQGPGTDRAMVAQIREALQAEEVAVVELLNYRKDGTPFWNALHLGPVYGEDHRLLYYFGSQWDVSDVHTARADEAHAKAMARELSHRMKNMFAVIAAIVSVTGRAHGIGGAAAAINDRIRALGRAYEPTLDDASLGSIAVSQAIRSVLRPYDPDGARIRSDGPDVRSDPNIVSVVGLVLHELATNAIKYGALSSEAGTIDVRWHVEDRRGHGSRLVVDWRERGGPPVVPPGGGSGSGHGIMETLLRAAEGEVRRDWRRDGLHAVVTMPIAAQDDAA